jgi:hypothetical protein
MLYFSDEAFRLFGFDPLRGLPSRDDMWGRIHPKDRERVWGEVQEALREKRDFRVPGLEAFAFEGTRARSRNKDGKNVPNATTAFKTVACLNVTLGHAKIG